MRHWGPWTEGKDGVLDDSIIFVTAIAAASVAPAMGTLRDAVLRRRGAEITRRRVATILASGVFAACAGCAIAAVIYDLAWVADFCVTATGPNGRTDLPRWSYPSLSWFNRMAGIAAGILSWSAWSFSPTIARITRAMVDPAAARHDARHTHS